MNLEHTKQLIREDLKFQKDKLESRFISNEVEMRQRIQEKIDGHEYVLGLIKKDEAKRK